MRKAAIAIVALSVLLAAALFFLVILYTGYSRQQDTAAQQKDTIAALTDKTRKLEQRLAASTEQIQETAEHVAELKHSQAVASKLKQTLAKKNGQIDDLEEQIGTLRSALSTISEEREALTQEIQQREDKLDQMRARNEALQSTISDLREKISGHEDIIEGLEKELERSMARLDTLQGKLQMESSQLGRLESDITEVEKQKAQLKKKLDQLQSTYDGIVRELKEEVERKEVTISQLEDKFSITFVDRILFDFGRSRVTSEGRNVLERLGERLKEISGCKIRVEGHTDNVPILPEYHYKYPSNWELSASRAAAVVRYFQKESGLEPEKMEAVGRSFYDPVASNDTVEGRARNRRVNILIVPELD